MRRPRLLAVPATRLRRLLLPAVLLLTSGVPAAAQADCWPSTARANFASSADAGRWGAPEDPYEILFGATSEGLARDLRTAIEDTGVWRSLSRHFGRPLQAPTSARYPIFVVEASTLDPEHDGETIALCDETGTAVLVPDTLSPDAVPYTIAHELSHAFQFGVAGVNFGDPWWIEATATHAGFALAGPPPGYASTYEEAFILRPDVPLDAPPTGEHVLHAYGAFRFVDFVFRRLADPERIPFVRATFRDLGRDTDATRVLREQLRRRRIDLNETLGRFWARQVSSASAEGPSAPAVTVPVPVGHRRIPVSARPLAAALRRLDLSPGVRKVEVSLPRDVAGGSRLLLVAGDDVFDWSDGAESLELCMGPAPGGTYPWPRSGKVFLVYVNGQGESDTEHVSLEGSRERCRPQRDWGALTCGPIPARFDNPRATDETPEQKADHEWELFLTRLTRIHWDLGAALFDAKEEGGTRRVRRLREARLTRCAAERVRALSVPELGALTTWDGKPGWISLQFSRDDLAANLEAVAAGLAVGQRRVRAMKKVSGRLYDIEFMRAGATGRAYDRAAGITRWAGHHLFWS